MGHDGGAFGGNTDFGGYGGGMPGGFDGFDNEALDAVWGQYDSIGYTPESDNPTVEGGKGSYMTERTKAMKPVLFSLLPTLMGLVGNMSDSGKLALTGGSIFSIIRASQTIDGLRDSIDANYEPEMAAQIHAAIDADFAAGRQGASPDDELAFLKQSVLKGSLPTTKKEMDRFMTRIHNPYKGSGSARDKQEYEEFLDKKVDALNSNTSDRLDTSQTMGVAGWYKRYLNDGTLPNWLGGGRFSTDNQGNRVNSDGTQYTAEESSANTTGEDTVADDDGTTEDDGTSSDTTSNEVYMPDTIPGNLQPGIENFVNDSQNLMDDYNTKANGLWDDYLAFEKIYFDKFEDVQNQYQDNINSIPQMNLKMPGTMGGAVVPLAPKVHSNMYSNQANTMGNLITSQGNTSLASMGSRNAVNNNMFTAGRTNLTNSLMPTQTALDLYKMERAGALGLQNTIAAQDNPSTLEAWSPVVGSLLTSSGGTTALESVFDFGKDLVTGLFT